MNTPDFFTQCFTTLTGYPQSMRWQRRLYLELLNGDLSASCNLPTGLGKTSILVLWLIALAEAPEKVARRLVYIVNRRTVVDQATDEARKMRENLANAPEVLERLWKLCSFEPATEKESPLAISSLRGQFADNAEWREDPAKPGIIIGTVDMIGSRLLFGGYGCGFKTRPTHAALLGQDSLIVHDEAHLEHPFQKLLERLKEHQKVDARRTQVMALTATSQTDEEEEQKTVFELLPDDAKDEIVAKRITSKKGIEFYEVESEKDVPEALIHRALEYRDSGEAILIFARSVKNVEKIVTALRREKPDNVEQLTGTLRGKERDELATSNPVFARFLPNANPPIGQEEPQTAYLVCTSAGEVGVNITADHLVCDLTTYESMAQRLGRVNRFGDGDAMVDVVQEEIEEKNDYETARQRTATLLRQLRLREDGKYDASPEALADLPANDRTKAFAPTPEILDVDDILFDKWGLTSIREDLPGRPDVTDWLHGVSEFELPQTSIAWRTEVAELDEELLNHSPPQKLLEAWPLKPHELLRDRTDRVFDHLKKIAKRHSEAQVWLMGAKPDDTEPQNLSDLLDKGKDELNHKTVLLPPFVGGLRNGLLTGTEKYDPKNSSQYDVSEQSLNIDGKYERGLIRYRIFEQDEQNAKPKFRKVMKIVFQLTPEERELETGSDDEEHYKIWQWFVATRSKEESGDDDSLSFSAPVEQELSAHLQLAETLARQIVAGVNLQDPERTAVVLAAKFHDLGKKRKLWQNGIGNWKYPQKVLAKSGNYRPPINKHYRHEFGSLHDVIHEDEFKDQSSEMQDLILHLIAAHHGRGRPYFPKVEAFDPENPDDLSQKTATEVPLRFARLERKYGRWGLAWLESLVRTADYKASQTDPKKDSKGEQL